MRRFITTTMVLVWAWGLAEREGIAAQTQSNEVDEYLRNRIEAAGVPPKITVGDEAIHASLMLPLFYERRTYRPAWSAGESPLPQVEALTATIREADREGLRPGDYHLARIEAIRAEVRQNQSRKAPLNPRRLVDLDLLLTDAFLVYGAHLLAGRVNPETIDAEWHANRRETDLAEALENALTSDRIPETLRSLLPPQPGYGRLKQALARYRELARGEGWPLVPAGPILKKGRRTDRVAALRARLVATGDLDRTLASQDSLFDEALEQAVRKFQQRHGLDVDGVVGPLTLAALNVPVESRVRQIEVNMERWRWLPQDLGQRYILVNTADFELDVVEESSVVMSMRVIVGRDYRRTPVFSDRMTYLNAMKIRGC